MNTKEHNEYKRNLMEFFGFDNNKTGLKCDKCGGEIVYSDNMILCSNPPRRNVKCVECDFTTTILE